MNTENDFLLKQKNKIWTVHPGIHVIGAIGNALSIETDLGIIQVDTGMTRKMAREVLDNLRTVSNAPVHTIIYSHGHNGYNHGAIAFIEAAEERNEPRPKIVAHERLPFRYRRYEETGELQQYLNAMQFRMPLDTAYRPSRYTYPDITFKETLRMNMGNRIVEVIWAPSETDDSIAIWLPEERVLYTGPAVIYSCINVGTPLRTQRDDVRWADTLDKLIALRPEVLIPSYGKPIKGEEEIQKMLNNMADGLRYLRKEVVDRMNQGMTDVEILHDITYPPEYFEHPWSQPIYGCPDMIVRDIYRSENGWWDRNPTNLHPADPGQSATAVADAIADKKRVLQKTIELKDSGEIQTALHVIDTLALAPGTAGEIGEAKKLKSELLHLRSKDVPSVVSTNLYLSAADRLDRETTDKKGDNSG
ncbi:MAG: MBL fold metallo-hydrolase [Deltaproteobacteria bacterium]|nr:MBL fold metallo-hydrolase [Deltaproteobacteria bacterium]